MKLQLRSLGEMLHRLRKLKRRTLIREPRNLTDAIAGDPGNGVSTKQRLPFSHQNLNGKMWRVRPRITASLSRCGNYQLESRMR